MHLLYALLAMLLVALFSLNMQRGIHATEQQMIVNEVATQLTGVGVDVLEHIERTPFDENTDESKQVPLEYPVITGTGQLTPDGGAQWGGCTSLALSDPSCDDIDDFDGVSVDVDVDGLVYTVEVAVQYVSPATTPATLAPSGAQTYAKEVTLTISNPYLLLGGTPLQVELKRVFTYNRHT